MKVENLIDLCNSYHQQIRIKVPDPKSCQGFYFCYIGEIGNLKDSKYLKSKIESISINNGILSIFIDE